MNNNWVFIAAEVWLTKYVYLVIAKRVRFVVSGSIPTYITVMLLFISYDV